MKLIYQIIYLVKLVEQQNTTQIYQIIYQVKYLELKTMKKIIISLLSFVICFGLLAQVAMAQITYGGWEYVTGSGLGTNNLKAMVFAIVNIILGFLGIVAIIIILIAGFRWMTSAGNEEKVTSARQMLIAGVIGLAIVLASWAIASFVLGSLLGATGA